ncbi:unnamed protein product [Colias eurytheme]|nr:unnamed protein product [Colias eurytheme]
MNTNRLAAFLRKQSKNRTVNNKVINVEQRQRRFDKGDKGNIIIIPPAVLSCDPCRSSRPIMDELPYRYHILGHTHNTSAHRLINKRGGAADACCASRDSPGKRARIAKAASMGAMAATRGHTTPAPAALARRRAHAAH